MAEGSASGMRGSGDLRPPRAFPLTGGAGSGGRLCGRPRGRSRGDIGPGAAGPRGRAVRAASRPARGGRGRRAACGHGRGGACGGAPANPAHGRPRLARAAHAPPLSACGCPRLVRGARPAHGRQNPEEAYANDAVTSRRESRGVSPQSLAAAAPLSSRCVSGSSGPSSRISVRALRPHSAYLSQRPRRRARAWQELRTRPCGSSRLGRAGLGGGVAEGRGQSGPERGGVRSPRGKETGRGGVASCGRPGADWRSSPTAGSDWPRA